MAPKTPEERRAARRSRQRRYWSRHREKKAAQRRAALRARPLGRPVDSYGALMAILAKHRRQLGLSQLSVDQMAGFQDGYTGKLEIGARRGGRNLGKWSLEIMLRTLGVSLVVVKNEAPFQIDPYHKRLCPCS